LQFFVVVFFTRRTESPSLRFTAVLFQIHDILIVAVILATFAF